MGNEEFSKELQGLKSRSEIPSTYEDVAGNWLSLLERIRGFYQDGNNSDPAYLEAREFCSSLIGKIRAYVKVDSYEKRLTENKAKMGANAILSVSLAVARAQAVSSEVELFEYLALIERAGDEQFFDLSFGQGLQRLLDPGDGQSSSPILLHQPVHLFRGGRSFLLL